MTHWYVNSVAYTAVAQWAANTSYSAGSIVRPLGGTNGAGRCFRTAGGGTSAASEPWWCTVPGGVTVTDDTITDWTEISGVESYQSPGAWSAPLGTLPQSGIILGATPAFAAGSGFAAGDLFHIAGGTFSQQCIIKVLTVTSGKPQTFSMYDPGSYSVLPSANPAPTAITGSGTGGTDSWTLSGLGSTRGAAGDIFFVSSNHAETAAATFFIQFPGTIANSNEIICVDESASGAVPPGPTNVKTGATVSMTATGAANITLFGSFHAYGINWRGYGVSSTLILADSTTVNEHQIYEHCQFSLTSSGGAVVINLVPTTAFGKTVEWINTTFFSSFANNTILIDAAKLHWRNYGSAGFGAGSAVPSNLIASGNYGGSIELDGIDLSLMTSGNVIAAGSASFVTIARNCKLNAGATFCATPTGQETDVYNYNCDSSSTNYRSEKHSYRGTESTNTTVTCVGGATDGYTAQSRQITTSANVVFSMPFQSMPMMIWNDLVGSTRNFTLYGTINAGSPPANNELWLEVEYFEDATSPMASFIDNRMANTLATPASQSADVASTWNGGGSGAGWSPFKLSVSFTAQQRGYIVARIKAAKASTTYYIDPPGAGTLS